MTTVGVDQATLDTLRDLYASEINFRISAFYGGGYHVQLGDDWNGFLEEQIGLMTWNEIAAWLTKAAIRHYPASAFTEKHGAPAPRPNGASSDQRQGQGAEAQSGGEGAPRPSHYSDVLTT